MHSYEAPPAWKPPPKTVASASHLGERSTSPIHGAVGRALHMPAAFDLSLEQYGPSIYPRLFWETGSLGQILYLEAEAAGIRSTGIGCFFDDAMHELLGIRDHSWQSLYHFTVGGAVDDPRLQTLPAYWHLK